MIKVNKMDRVTLNLSQEHDNDANGIQFDIGEWVKKFGPGTVTLTHKRKGDKIPYPVNLEVEDGIATWIVSDVDTAVKGYGAAQLMYQPDDTEILAQSAVAKTLTLSSNYGIGSTPDPYDNWMAELTEKAGETLHNVSEAKAAEIGAKEAEANAEQIKADVDGLKKTVESEIRTAHEDISKAVDEFEDRADAVKSELNVEGAKIVADATTAKNEAVTAKNGAESAAERANESKEAAANKAIEAKTYRDQAETFKNKAAESKADAEAVKTAVNEAKSATQAFKEETAEIVQGFDAKVSSAKGEIDAKKAEAVKAVEDTIADIPEDYSALVEDVSNVKKDLSSVKDVTVVSKAETVKENITSVVTTSEGYMTQSGAVSGIGGDYVHTEKIPVSEGDIIKTEDKYNSYRFVTAFDGDTAIPSKGVNTNVFEYVVPEGIDSVVFSIEPSAIARGKAFIHIYQKTYYENIYKEQAEHSDEIFGFTVVERVHWNLLDELNVTDGKYIGANGNLNNNPSYRTSDFIEVEEGKTYTAQVLQDNGTYKIGNINQICGFNEFKEAVSGSYKSYVNNYTVPDGVKYIRYSSDTSLNHIYKPMFVEGIVPLEYEPYSDEPFFQRFINGKYVKNSQDIPSGYTATASLNASEKIALYTGTNHLHDYVITFKADIDDGFGGIKIGKGANKSYGYSLSVDKTNIATFAQTSGTAIITDAHHLNFKDYILVKIKATKGNADIEILTNGGSYTKKVNWDARMDDVFALALSGGTPLNNCTLGYYCSDFEADAWLFGDSYFSTTDPSRWTTYLVNSGAKNYMLDAYGGRGSATALVSFRNNLRKAKPKRVVWCMGMNDADSDTAINATWFSSYEEVKKICNVNNIELILATIPNCPNRNHTFKNEVVRNSGYRYIDFATAVGATEKDSFWYANMLYSDNTHPAVEGAKALYAQAICDVPELLG